MGRRAQRLARLGVVSASLVLGVGVVWMTVGSAAASDPYGNTPPDCSAVVATPSVVVQSEHRAFVLITLSGATDVDGDALTFRIDGVTQDEPVSGAGTGDNTTPDASYTGAGPDSNQVNVRAERNPMGNGRVYRIAYTVSDGSATCSGTAKVSVPRRGHVAVDDGDATRWNSFTGAQVTP